MAAVQASTLVQHYHEPLTSLAPPAEYTAAISCLPDQSSESGNIRLNGVVHDFNNLLAIILTHTSIALNKLPLESQARGYLERAMRTARRAAELSSQLMTDLKSQRVESAPVDLNQVILETVDLLNPKLSPKAEVRLHLASDLTLVQANDSQMQQVIMNPLMNAADAIDKPAGRIIVTTRNLTLPALRHERPTMLPAGKYIYLQVEDNGVGLDQATMDQIFEPFFTTKATGSGIGLTATMSIIQTHRGGVEVFSTPGQGTTFRVILPALGDLET